MTHIEAMKQALEALENHNGNYKLSKAECAEINKVCDNLRQAIAEAEKQEPVEYIRDVVEGLNENGDPISVEAAELIEKLYFHPQPKAEQEPKREWVGLTDEEFRQLMLDVYNIEVKPTDYFDDILMVRAVEAKLKEKNT